MSHLSEDRLNEYLDQSLAPDLFAETQVHLTACSACSARLAELEQLFAQIGSLADQAMDVDLSVAILLNLKQPDRLPRAIWNLSVLQAALVCLIAIFAWPLAQAALPLVFFSKMPPLAELLARFTGIVDTWFALAGRLQLPGFSLAIPSLDLPTTSLVFAAFGLLLLWLAGNGLFFFSHSRRRS